MTRLAGTADRSDKVPADQTPAREAPSPIELPKHIEASVAGISEFHAEHHRKASRSHRLVQHLVGIIASPGSTGLILVLVLGWVGINSYLDTRAGAFDPMPFPLLAAILQAAGFVVMVLILITQRHDAKLAEYREHLTLQLGILADQRSAKIIDLIEQLRRDSSTVVDRVDEEATALSVPTNPEALLKIIKKNSDDLALP